MAKVDWDTKEYNEGRNPDDFEPLPKGRYFTRVERVERKDTKNKNGYYFEVEGAVEGGEFKSRRLWARLNVSNPSDIAQRIGREQFNALCVACGFAVGGVRDTKELVGKRCMFVVDVERDNEERLRNKVTGFIVATDGDRVAAKTPAKPAPKSNAKPANKPDDSGDVDEDDIPF